MAPTVDQQAIFFFLTQKKNKKQKKQTKEKTQKLWESAVFFCHFTFSMNTHKQNPEKL